MITCSLLYGFLAGCGARDAGVADYFWMISPLGPMIRVPGGTSFFTLFGRGFIPPWKCSGAYSPRLSILLPSPMVQKEHIPVEWLVKVAANNDVIFTPDELDHVQQCPKCFNQWVEFVKCLRSKEHNPSIEDRKAS